MDRPDSDPALLLGGILTVGFGAVAVMTAIDLGWVAAALLGVVLLVVAGKVPTERVLTAILAVLGVVALVGAVFGLVT